MATYKIDIDKVKKASGNVFVGKFLEGISEVHQMSTVQLVYVLDKHFSFYATLVFAFSLPAS